jgi:hypothetical protein
MALFRAAAIQRIQWRLRAFSAGRRNAAVHADPAYGVVRVHACSVRILL